MNIKTKDSTLRIFYVEKDENGRDWASGGSLEKPADLEGVRAKWAWASADEPYSLYAFTDLEIGDVLIFTLTDRPNSLRIGRVVEVNVFRTVTLDMYNKMAVRDAFILSREAFDNQYTTSDTRATINRAQIELLSEQQWRYLYESFN